MRIYVSHSTTLNYRHSLYSPLKTSVLWQQHYFILPHDEQSDPINSKAIISEVNLVIAEVSYPSTGFGIELGWANIANRPILCLHQFWFPVVAEAISRAGPLLVCTTNFRSVTGENNLPRKCKKELSRP